ncbi:MAG: hypothetical protein JSR77_11285 [Planctomycetes bacterium]|nr:hypothetical protein [Planctomycetota bacterium]
MRCSTFARVGSLTSVLICGLSVAQAPAEPPKAETPKAEATNTEAPVAVGDAAKHEEASGFPVKEDEKVKVSVSPYMWLTGFEGDVTVKGVELHTSTSFVDILDKTDHVFGLMGAVDIQYERLVWQFDGAWTMAKASKDRGFGRNGTVDGNLDIESGWFELFTGYRIVDAPMVDDAASRRRFSWDAFVGGRITSADVTAKLTTSANITLPGGEVLTPGQTRERSDSETWAEPFVGTRIGIDLSEHWSVQLRGDIGGFGVSGCDFSWQAAAVIGYRWDFETWSIAAFGGYRAIGQDYTNGDFTWDMIVNGPILGAEMSFAF